MLNTPDPILDAIKAYQRGVEAFNACPDGKEDEFSYLWKEPHDVLSRWTEPAISREGAKAALALAIEEDEIGDSLVTGPMMRAAFSYFEKEVSA